MNAHKYIEVFKAAGKMFEWEHLRYIARIVASGGSGGARFITEVMESKVILFSPKTSIVCKHARSCHRETHPLPPPLLAMARGKVHLDGGWKFV